MEEVANAISRGFQDNEIWVWIVQSDRRLARMLPRNYRAVMKGYYMPMGTAWTTPGRVGGALWVPPGRLERSSTQKVREVIALLPWLGPGGMRRGSAFEELQRRHHPAEPHWYLETLSISPEHQRAGYGSALMAPGLERADADGVPCYLETQREANIPFYRRFGFEVTDKVTTLDSPPLWLMWRPARAHGDSP
jgi:GNAT superfamily N-acetyltransferase